MCKSAVPGDTKHGEPKIKLARSEEDAIELFIINTALEFLFSWMWRSTSGMVDLELRKGDGQPGVGEANPHKHSKSWPWVPPDWEGSACSPAGGAWSGQQDPLPRFTNPD